MISILRQIIRQEHGRVIEVGKDGKQEEEISSLMVQSSEKKKKMKIEAEGCVLLSRKETCRMDALFQEFGIQTRQIGM